MIDQLMALDHRSVDLVEGKKSDDQAKLSEWRTFNTKLLALKTAAQDLKAPENFFLYTSNMSTDDSAVKAADLLSVTASSSASKGSYEIIVDALASAQKLSSKSFSTYSEALGASYAGDILINGRVVSVSATDSLADVRNKINNANSGATPTGATAGIIRYGTGDYRMVFTSDSTGASGIGLLNGGTMDILNQFGFTDGSRTAKNHLAGGDWTDRFTSTNASIQSLLGLTTSQTSLDNEIVINGQTVEAIQLNTDTLSTLQTKLSTAGLTATIMRETENNQTYYRLMVSGAANTYTDKNNILETLGFIKGGVSDVYGVTGDVANTAGGSVITADTLIKDIDGYTGYLNTDYIHLEGTNTDGNPVSDDTLILSDTTTIGDLLTKIQSLFGNVTASITGAGKLTVADNTPGTSPLAVQISVKNFGGTADDTLKFDADGNLGSAVSVRKRQIVSGADASLQIDGVAVTSRDNAVKDVLPGVTINLLKADPKTTLTLNVDRDIDAVMNKIQGFVNAYNAVSVYLKEQQSYDQENARKGGILFGDGTLSSVKTDLTSTLIRQVWGVSSELSTLGLVGINVDNEGQLSISDDKLRGYLKTNFNDIKNLFSANGSTDAGTLEYISSSRDTKAGTYVVNITQAATPSTTTSDTAVSGVLGADEALTVREGTRTATISLTSGMIVSDIINAVNTELDAVYTERLVGTEALTAGSNPASAATTWGSIDGANLVDGDVISFTGTSRNGQSVSGSYVIGQASTDTVQGLLSAMELAFGNGIDATIDASGHLVVTDKHQGDSQLSITFDYSQAHELDFGSVSTTSVGGQEGRYAMDITASNDGSDHLILSHNSYGSNSYFTVEEDTDSGLWAGSQTNPVNVNNGSDVVGTINGEDATGTGQLLVGNDGAANIGGLAVKYSGSSTGSAGSITLTLGVAELFERALYSITDTYAGYLTFKQESLQISIDSFDTQIGEMEARLNRKMEMMINRFVAMELALSKIQSQSNWLSGQLTAAQNGWGSL
jgi:flagellar hook-associated protein 2